METDELSIDTELRTLVKLRPEELLLTSLLPDRAVATIEQTSARVIR